MEPFVADLITSGCNIYMVTKAKILLAEDDLTLGYVIKDKASWRLVMKWCFVPTDKRPLKNSKRKVLIFACWM